MLIFVPHASDEGLLEDYARRVYREYTLQNVPTWIIGPALGGGPLMKRPADMLKVVGRHASRCSDSGRLSSMPCSTFSPASAVVRNPNYENAESRQDGVALRRLIPMGDRVALKTKGNLANYGPSQSAFDPV